LREASCAGSEVAQKSAQQDELLSGRKHPQTVCIRGCIYDLQLGKSFEFGGVYDVVKPPRETMKIDLLQLIVPVER
jgi:hypothetical protein